MLDYEKHIKKTLIALILTTSSPLMSNLNSLVCHPKAQQVPREPGLITICNR